MATDKGLEDVPEGESTRPPEAARRLLDLGAHRVVSLVASASRANLRVSLAPSILTPRCRFSLAPPRRRPTTKLPRKQADHVVPFVQDRSSPTTMRPSTLSMT